MKTKIGLHIYLSIIDSDCRPVRPFLSGSGFAAQLYMQRYNNTAIMINRLMVSCLFSLEFKFGFFLINMFCSQGDNIPDGVAMATHLNNWLQLVR